MINSLAQHSHVTSFILMLIIDSFLLLWSISPLCLQFYTNKAATVTLYASLQFPDLAARSTLLKNSVTDTGPSPFHDSIKLDMVRSFTLVDTPGVET
jgi:hypothetical protein